MTWSTANADLRKLLDDGPTDKLRYRKKCIGSPTDGVNTRFKSFEDRRVTNFTTATAPQGVYVDNLPAVVTEDFPDLGEFVLTVPPIDGQVISATYYYRWFDDDEIDEFLSSATQWLGLGADPNSVPDGLQPSAKQYAASEAYQKLSIRWAEQWADTYRLEDQADPSSKAAQDPYIRLAKDMRTQAKGLRDDFYKRQGQPLSPLFGFALGRVKDVVPKR